MWNTVKLTPEQDRKWIQTRTSVLYQAPMFAHVLYTMMNSSGSEDMAIFVDDPKIPWLATDGDNIIINPDGFFKLSLDERVFGIVHEICHGIFDHCGLSHKWRQAKEVKLPNGKKLPYDDDDMNRAMDYVINDMLIQAKIGKYRPDWLHDTSIATQDDSVVDAYFKVHKNKPKPPSGGGGGTQPGKGGQKGFDQHLAPGSTTGKDPNQQVMDRDAKGQEWANAVAAGLAAARMQGKLPAGIERVLGELLEPVVTWQDHIAALFARKVGAGGYDWRKPDRRLISRPKDPIYLPARSGKGIRNLVFGVDTSGSVGDPEIARFFSELGGAIEDLNPRSTWVLWCDAKVHRVDQLDDYSDLQNLRAKRPPGGGGTAFKPVFDEVQKLGIEPDALVYLTDGIADFRFKEPRYPLIWGSVMAKPEHFPFGDVVMIPLK